MIGPGKKEIDVNIQSQTLPLFQYFLMNEQKTDITLTSIISLDDEVINVSGGHGFTAAAGEYMVIRKGDLFTQAKVTSVSTNAISVSTPMSSIFPIDSIITRGNINMNVNGSVTPVEFKCPFLSSSNAIVPIDLSTLVATMAHAIAGDDGKFGGIPALSKGVFVRIVNGDRVSLGNYQSNRDFRHIGAKVEYTDKAPGGINGTNVTVDLVNIFKQEIRINPRNDDITVATVRDKIDADEGIAAFNIVLLGSFTSGE